MAKRGETRESILRAAIHLFATKGFNNTSLQDIAKACGITTSASLYHFKNKEALIVASLQMIVQNNLSVVQKEMNPRDDALVRLRKHFQGNLMWALEFREEAQIILLLYYTSSFDMEAQALYRKILHAARSRIEEYLFAAQREHLIPGDIEVKSSAELLHDSLLGGIVNMVASGAGMEHFSIQTEKWRLLLQSLLRMG